MSESLPLSVRVKRHFLDNQRLWVPSLILFWAMFNTVLLATTTLMDARRQGRELMWWEPFCWEISSIVIILLCFWPLIRLHERLLGRLSVLPLLLVHCFLTLPFSLIHVTGMVMLREICYWSVGWNYDFGDWSYEFFYEYRKDAVSYFIILTVVVCYQFIVRRLRGEASYIATGESSSQPVTDRLLVKKLGKEFLISIPEIRWVEASGNYANLHVHSSVYPMRITMAKLETLLPSETFIRVHRSFIVNMDFVSHIQPLDAGDHRICLKGGEELTLSRRYRDSFRLAMTGVG